MDRPILSLCIPTASRTEILEVTINTIIIQEPFLDNRIEVVISDNSSDCNTEQMILPYVERYSRIKYYKNETNVGGVNFAKALERGTGLYRKLINDTCNYRQRCLSDMVNIIEKNKDEKPILLWKIYHRNAKEVIFTNEFDTIMRGLSYWSTWIASYGIWEDEADGITEHCEKARNTFVDNIKKSCGKDNVYSKEYAQTSFFYADPLWQMRYLKDVYKNKKRAAIYNCAENWISNNVPKNFKVGELFWTFLSYYSSILLEFVSEGVLSKNSYDELERDVGFSFFVQNMIFTEFGNGVDKFDPSDTLCSDVINWYKDKPYFNEFINFYQKQRERFLI